MTAAQLSLIGWSHCGEGCDALCLGQDSLANHRANCQAYTTTHQTQIHEETFRRNIRASCPTTKLPTLEACIKHNMDEMELTILVQGWIEAETPASAPQGHS